MESAFCVKNGNITNKLRSNVDIHYGGKTCNVIALWDTGATNSCISMDVVNTLGLVMTGKIPMQTPSGDGVRNTYLVDITLPNDVQINDLMVCDSEIGAQGIGMLIGMDIITRGDFLVTNDQRTVFSFRFPSESLPDFVTGIKASNIISNRHGKGGRHHGRK